MPRAVLPVFGTLGTLVTWALVSSVPGAHGHCYVMFPVSRQYWSTPVFHEKPYDVEIEFCPSCFDAGNVDAVMARQESETDATTFATYGDGAWPLYTVYEMGEMADNGNFIEPEAVAVRHGICGDPRQGMPEETNMFGTANKNWPVLHTFEEGSIIDIKVVVTAYHWGHMEFFVCDTNDLDDPENDVVTQECFNKYPLTRADGDESNSPIDPAYPGRRFMDPECREYETDQTKPENAHRGYVSHMQYKLPDGLTCDHCVLQMVWFTGHLCKYPGYDEFEPDYIASDCAPTKDDWILSGSMRKLCGTEDKYPEEFWACSDFAITSDGSALSTPPPTTNSAAATTSSYTQTSSDSSTSSDTSSTSSDTSSTSSDTSSSSSDTSSSSSDTSSSSSDTSSSSCDDPVAADEQCGGIDYTGSTCCDEGYSCEEVDGDDYSECQYVEGACAEAWDRCGGTVLNEEYTGPTCCYSGYVCLYKEENWSQCVTEEYAASYEG